MFLSAIENPVQTLTQPELTLMGVLVLASLLVYLRYFQRLAVRGPQTRPDLLGLPEMLAGSLIMFLFGVSKLGRPTGQQSAVPSVPTLEMLVSIALPALAIIILLLARGGSISAVFGIRKVGLFRAIGIGVLLAILALPLTNAAKGVTVWLTSSQEAPQVLVQNFNSAATGSDARVMGLIAFSACVIAPITEEVLFRGTFYPMLARGFGRGPAALVSALFFAVVHDTVTDIPGLTVLALCFTLAYEVTGSLLVPIFMHATFNGLSLLVIWLQAQFVIHP